MRISWRSCDQNQITLLLGTMAVAFLNSYGWVFMFLCVSVYLWYVFTMRINYTPLWYWGVDQIEVISCLLMCYNCRTRCLSIVGRSMSVGKISRASWWVSSPVLSDLIPLPCLEMTSRTPHRNVSIKERHTVNYKHVHTVQWKQAGYNKPNTT